MNRCAHCQKQKSICARGLCYRCYRDHSIRRHYPSKRREQQVWENVFDDIDVFVQSGLDLLDVCRRLGVTVDTFGAACRRHDRVDLYWLFADRCDDARFRRGGLVAHLKRRGAA